jgi:cell division protein FtsN
MTRNDDYHLDKKDGVLPGDDASPNGSIEPHEPKFGRFYEDEDEYEEPDRDTDYSSGYRADNVEAEEEFEKPYSDDEDHGFLTAEEDDEPEYLSSSVRSESGQSVADGPDEWLEKEDYLEKEEYLVEDEDSGRKWPLGLIAVATAALVLLIGGGYGVMQQRAATEEELRQLRATLATSANPVDESASREALQELQKSYDKLAADAEALKLENRRLTDTVAGLEAQLGVQQAVITKATPAAKQVKPEVADAVASLYEKKPQPSTKKVEPATTEKATLPQPAAVPEPAAAAPIAPKPAASPTTPAVSSGPWFVNFGSYGSRNMAETWANKLSPSAGKVIVAPSVKDGQTFYRVRVVELASRGSADEVARQLEAQMRVSKLWVGKE